MTGCEILEWDSDFLGRLIVRVDAQALQAAGAAAVEEWCNGQRAECAYLLVGADDQRTLDLAQASGFRLVDLRITLAGEASPRAPSGPPRDHTVRPLRPEDIPALRAIARESHHDTRFYADPHFDRQRCDDLYDLWIAKSCQGWADQVLVAVQGEAPVGYVTCHLRPDEGQIGLVGVAKASRGHGCAGTMIDETLRWFAQHGTARVSVATQGRNAAGLRLYQRAGLSVRSIECSFHRWF